MFGPGVKLAGALVEQTSCNIAEWRLHVFSPGSSWLGQQGALGEQPSCNIAQWPLHVFSPGSSWLGQQGALGEHTCKIAEW